MTTRLVVWLAIAACLQLVAVAVLYWPPVEPARKAGADAALLQLSQADIARIKVTDINDRSVSLVRRGEKWIIEGDAPLPAAGSAIARLLDALAAPTGFPVARSDSARERFEVDAERFQRRITLTTTGGAGETGAEDRQILYLGTSPSMRRVHARRSDSTAIQTIELSTFDVPTTIDGWVDPSLLSMAGIRHVAVGNHAWIKSGEVWTAADGTPAVETPTSKALRTLEKMLEALQVTGVAPPDRAEATALPPPVEVTLRHAGREVTLALAGAGVPGEARLYSSHFDRWFTLSEHDHDQLAEALTALRPDQTPQATREAPLRALVGQKNNPAQHHNRVDAGL